MGQDRSSVQEREQQQLQQLESKKREAEKLEQLRLKAMQQTESTQEKINLKYTSSTAVGYGQVTTGQVSSRKYEILARASSVGRFEDREGLNPEMMMRAQSQSTSARGSPAPIAMAQKASGLVTSEVDASQQMMSKAQFSKQVDFASTTAALSTGLTRRQTTSTSKMASSSEVKSVSSHQMSMSSSFQMASSSSSSFSSVQQSTSAAQQSLTFSEQK